MRAYPGMWAPRTRRTRVGPTVLAGLLIPCGILAGCRGDAAARDDASERDVPLLVLAAANLTTALEAAEPAFEAATGDEVTLVFGSSGNLAAQIRNGAPADVYISANEAFLDDLVSEGRIDPGTRTEVTVGRLALVVPEGRPLPEGMEAIAGPIYPVVAIANPEHAPYGMAARSALKGAGVWARLGDRLVQGENVAQTLQYVRTGNADAGLVALSLVLSGGTERGGVLPHRVVDASLHAPLLQVGGIVRPSARASRAASFLAWITGPEGAAILRRYGFEPPTP